MSSEHVKILPVSPAIQHVANGTQRAFSFPFAIFTAADIEVYLNSTKQSGNFTVAGLRVSSGGTVTFNTAPAAGVTVTLRRRMVLERTTDFMPYDKFRASVINDELDYLAAGLQQLAAEIDGCVRLAPEEIGTPAGLDLPARTARANKWLGFDAAGEVIAGQPTAAVAGASWGAITGTLSAQTDLQGALNQKASSSHNHDGAYATTAHNHDASYISIISSPATGKFPTMTTAGELQTSSYGPSSFAAASHTHTAAQLSLGGSLTNAAGTLQLAGDAASPGGSRYYGTDGGGAKGFFPLPEAGAISIKDEGAAVASGVNSLNFTGAGVTASSTDSGEVTVSVSGAGATNAFGTIKVGTTTIEADAAPDTLTLVAGAGIGIAATPSSDTLTFTASFAGSGSAANVARSDHTHAGVYVPTIAPATAGNFPTLTAAGALQNSTYAPSSFALAGHTHTGGTLTDKGDFYGKTIGAGLADSSGAIGVAASLDANARVAVRKAGTLAGTRRALNLIQGSNVTLTVADNAASEAVDVTIGAASGGSTFSTIAVSGQPSVVADAAADTLTLVAGGGLAITTNATTDSITIGASFAGTGSAATVARSDHNHDGTYAAAGHNHDGVYAPASAGNAFGTIAVGTINLVADAAPDTLNLKAGNGIGISANASTDTLTFSVSFLGTGSAVYAARSDHNHDATYVPIIVTPANGNFPTMTAAGGLQSSSYNAASFAAAAHTHTAAQLSLGGSLVNASGALQLAGDAATPGASRYYGTDAGGARGWHAMTAGGAVGGSDGTLQYNSAGALGGSSFLSYAASAKLLKTPLVGGRIHDAGTISGSWSPPLAQGAQVILAAASTGFTLAVPSGVTLPTDHEVYLHLVITNSGSTMINVNFDVGETASQYRVLHKRPLAGILPGATVEYYVRWLGSRWYLVGPQPSSFPITFQVSGVPEASSVLFGMYVHNFGLVGGLYVPFKLDDVGNVTCGTAPSATTAFSIERSPAGQLPWAQIGTLTFAANQKDWSTWSFPAGVTRFDHGDRLRIVAPANLNGLADLTWIMGCLS